jgi:hypothetical protein
MEPKHAKEIKQLAEALIEVRSALVDNLHSLKAIETRLKRLAKIPISTAIEKQEAKRIEKEKKQERIPRQKRDNPLQKEFNSLTFEEKLAFTKRHLRK